MSVRHLSILTLLAVAACQGSDPRPFTLIDSRQLYSSAWLAGGGASGVVGYVHWTGYGASELQLLRHDVAAPDQLLDLGTVTFPGWTPKLHSVSSTTATLGGGNLAILVDLDGPAPVESSLTTTLSFDLAVAEGRWLLVAAGSELELVDRDVPSSHFAFSAGAPVTGLLPSQGQFLAFTASGFVRVQPDPASPLFTEGVDAAVRGFQSCFPDGAAAIVGGSASTSGRSRIARLDLSDLAAPAVVASREVEGDFAALSWDGAQTSLLEIAGAPSAGIYEGYLIREDDAGFSAKGVALPLWYAGGTPHAALHRERLFLLKQVSDPFAATTDIEFSFWRVN